MVGKSIRLKRLGFAVTKAKGATLGIARQLFDVSDRFLAHEREPGLESKPIEVRQFGLATGQTIVARRVDTMRLWVIQWDDIGGEEYTQLVASKGMDATRARAYAQQVMLKLNKYADPDDISNVAFKRILGVKDLSGGKYNVALEVAL